jgi:hypothetical protein
MNEVCIQLAGQIYGHAGIISNARRPWTAHIDGWLRTWSLGLKDERRVRGHGKHTADGYEAMDGNTGRLIAHGSA